MQSESEEYRPSIEKQREEWSSIRKHITDVMENLHNRDALETYRRIFDVNIVTGKDILINTILTGKYDPRRLALLASSINIDYTEFGQSLIDECVRRFIFYFKNVKYYECFRMMALLSQLYNYDAVHMVVILYALQSMSEEIENTKDKGRQEASMSLICRTLMNCGKKLLDSSEKIHNQLVDQLRQLLQDNRYLSSRTIYDIEQVLEVRQKQYTDVPEQELLEKPFGIEDDWSAHAVLVFIDPDFLSKPPNFKLGEFSATKRHDQDVETFNKIHETVERRIMKVEELRNEETETVVVHNMTDSEATDFKKKIYLTLKSSLSGDEAAHKLLKMRIPDSDKHCVADILERSMIQEATYSKFYGLVTEKLLGAHRIWKNAFLITFRNRLDTLDDLEPNGLRNSGKFWGHLLSTDLLGFEVFNDIKMTEAGSTAQLRIFVKFLFQEIVFEIGINELSARLNEGYIQPYLKGMFPKEDPDDMRYAINYFTAINLGVLTESMRRELQILEEQAEEEEEEDEEEVEEEEEEEEEDIPKEEISRKSRYEPHQSNQERSQQNHEVSKRRRSVTPPRRQANNKRRRSVTPPRRRNRG
ncbi:similar to Saccharomyces cerevisiae YGR278W CWC22 Spliceosome-associated protein that is required for pre-mRNA splicing [Maudiozyma barnettii]|uniref:Pre-mRNA-splicing factor CWC22 n=1 Tax=Maudiozyma barnettii TaxID=61262 RepID=A0A8H2ZHU2_9SACH|nr:U2-type spliceosomal complex subunit CWC22 [Kazachstania barnettii]CAB4256149.1 similar to Saccharomyces cerevisiae YGR278W CWC22 Spliceosome-associated protein that is required for pre-mRNA splicing [Kazachstania barnettii]CAD1784757.1 similar to Saccharomyces cerevisiae YGR278W CWC22 Spliceosome-associated protein that is required for pre-mRNA splicing [Kazachstania barnettii]